MFQTGADDPSNARGADWTDWADIPWSITPRPDLAALDFLGRMPLPLRRGFRAGLDRVAARQRARGGRPLSCCFLMGSEWYHPFDEILNANRLDAFPDMIASPLSVDMLAPAFQRRVVAGGGFARFRLHDLDPVCAAAGLDDPEGFFTPFAIVPLVFLVDHAVLGDLPPPRRWSDLLDPRYRRNVMFGGWRPNARVPYQDYNDFLFLALYHEFGAEGMRALAGNVKHLLSNVRVARIAGSGHPDGAAIAIMPWLQADICPRRDRTSVIWPEDGAIAMPICFLAKEQRLARLAPLLDHLTGRELGAFLSRNRYPPILQSAGAAFRPDQRLKWPGWDYVRSHSASEDAKTAARLFFAAWTPQ